MTQTHPHGRSRRRHMKRTRSVRAPVSSAAAQLDAAEIGLKLVSTAATTKQALADSHKHSVVLASCQRDDVCYRVLGMRPAVLAAVGAVTGLQPQPPQAVRAHWLQQEVTNWLLVFMHGGTERSVVERARLLCAAVRQTCTSCCTCVLQAPDCKHGAASKIKVGVCAMDKKVN
jgi:hypothetical protein